jgi:predicted ArsR family transcriptional regulator
MTTTRNLVLENLLNRQRCTINDLAEAVDINPISVRHHISRLELEGLVSSIEERHGVGRPRRVYFLTEQGVETFPARTVRLTTQLIDQLKESLPSETVTQLFKDMALNMSKEYGNGLNLKALTLDERLNLLKEWLTYEGFNVQIEQSEEQVLIRETSCPYIHVGKEHSEVCTFDQALITEVLDATPERTTCLLDGDNFCTYILPLESIRETTIAA